MEEVCVVRSVRSPVPHPQLLQVPGGTVNHQPSQAEKLFLSHLFLFRSRSPKFVPVYIMPDSISRPFAFACVSECGITPRFLAVTSTPFLAPQFSTNGRYTVSPLHFCVPAMRMHDREVFNIYNSIRGPREFNESISNIQDEFLAS